MALVWRAGSQAPVVVDFKDQAPAAASLDNPAVLRDGRLVDHGPAALNIPGVVAGMDHLHSHYGSGRVAWADLIAPAIDYAAGGFVLDGTLPATVAEGQATAGALRRRAGAVPARRAGCRSPAIGSSTPISPPRCASSRRRGPARSIAASWRGGWSTTWAATAASSRGEDLEQYRVVERAPVRGTFRGHVVFSTPPPVASGTALIEVLQTLDRQPAVAGGAARARRRRRAPADRDVPPRPLRAGRGSRDVARSERRASRARARRRHLRPDRSAPGLDAPARPPTRTAPRRRAAEAAPPPWFRVRARPRASGHASAAAPRRWSPPIATATWWWSPRR